VTALPVGYASEKFRDYEYFIFRPAASFRAVSIREMSKRIYVVSRLYFSKKRYEMGRLLRTNYTRTVVIKT